MEGKQDIWVIGQACSVRMAGYWPSPLFCEFMDQDEVEAHKCVKKERGHFSAIWNEQPWSIKDLLLEKIAIFSQDTASNPEREIACPDSQSQRGTYRFIVAAHGVVSRILRTNKYLPSFSI